LIAFIYYEVIFGVFFQFLCAQYKFGLILQCNINPGMLLTHAIHQIGYRKT